MNVFNIKHFPWGWFPMMNDDLVSVLTEVVSADCFSEELYKKVFRALDAKTNPNKLKGAIANALEEYYNYHNRRRIHLLGSSSHEPIPPEAEEERNELRLYVEALRQGITDFRSLKDLKSTLHQSGS
jgi:hypothetical protein